MSDLPSPRAPRLAKPRWVDGRLMVGVLLVLASVAIGAKLFAEADERVDVWAVTRDLAPDSTLSERDLVVVSVRLDATARRYVSAEQSLHGLVLARAVGRHELLPVAALRKHGSSSSRRVVIEVDRFSAAALDKGSVVDVYAVRKVAAADDHSPPELVLTGVTVADARKEGRGGFGAGGATVGVIVVIPQSDVASLIDAVSHGVVYLVEVPHGEIEAPS